MALTKAEKQTIARMTDKELSDALDWHEDHLVEIRLAQAERKASKR